MFPTREEILELIKNGAKCPRCQKNPATLMSISGASAIGNCNDCKKIMEEKSSKIPKGTGKIINPDRVHSVWTAPDGSNIPVNERGDVINPVHAKYERRKGEKPLW
jgi:ribosomal protein L37AE/L43A